MVPKFNEEGNLPVGIHKVEWPEFREKFGHNHYRKKLIRGMLYALKSLKKQDVLRYLSMVVLLLINENRMIMMDVGLQPV